MAFTTHPNHLDSKRGLRAGLIGLGFVAVAGVAALGFSVVDYDSTQAPAAVDFPTVDEMRAENMEIRPPRGLLPPGTRSSAPRRKCREQRAPSGRPEPGCGRAGPSFAPRVLH